MTLTNSSITVADDASGTEVATHTISTKDFQAMLLVDASGHIWGTKPTYIWHAPLSVGVAAARTAHFDLFNASGSGLVLKILGIYAEVGLTTAVTGVGMTWELVRTTAVGTGGTTITGNPVDTANAAVHANITARQKPTGGATAGTTLFATQLHSEETNSGVGLVRFFNILRWWNEYIQPFTIREGEGFRIDQVTSSSAGNFGWIIVGTLE